MARFKLVLIGGPTASGKSRLALEMALRENGTVINADAMQVYKGLPVLTAQPSEEDRARVPHVLYEVLDAAEKSSVARWKELAESAIASAVEAGRVPIVVGGTGLYFKALCEGLVELPEIPEATRSMAQGLYDSLGEDAFRSILWRLDPVSAERIKPNDRQRLVRAYEVVAHTGKSLSAWQEGQAGAVNPFLRDVEIQKIALMPERETLYATCDARFAQMIERGAVEEVRQLVAQNLDEDYPAMKILGVAQLADYLRGDVSLAVAVSKAQQLTRNYAKRQLTWFRHQWKEARQERGSL